MLLPHSTNENGSDSLRSGSSTPGGGHCFDAARRKKYEEMRRAKIIPSVAITVITPHHAVE